MGRQFQRFMSEVADIESGQSSCSHVQTYREGSKDDEYNGAEHHVQQLLFYDFVVICQIFSFQKMHIEHMRQVAISGRLHKAYRGSMPSRSLIRVSSCLATQALNVS